MEQVRGYVPGLANLKEKLSFVSRAPERNSAVLLTTLCGSSSMFTQVTVAPALTVRGLGVNMNSWITIRFGSGVCAADGIQIAPPHKRATPTMVSHGRYRLEIMKWPPLPLSAGQLSAVSSSASALGCLTTETLVMPSIAAS